MRETPDQYLNAEAKRRAEEIAGWKRGAKMMLLGMFVMLFTLGLFTCT